MATDTERDGRGGFSGSSHAPNPELNLDRLAGNSARNSKRGPAKDAGKAAETKLTSLDVLLSMLQSHLGEIRDFGGNVRLFSDPNGLIIQLPNVAICPAHKMMHSGQQCPMC